MKVPRRLVRPLAAVLSLVVAGIVALAVPAQEAGEPRAVAAPRANCDPGSRPEPSIQGRVPREEVDSGRAEKGYWCNLTAVGHSGSTGGFRVHRYVDKSGHECAYYDTALLFPTNATSLSAEATGVAVLDMSDPRNPVQTETLVTPAMQTPHESLNISVQRGVLAAVMGNPTQYPGGVDVYDISGDCRHPEPMAAAFPATPFGHESGMAPDGMTFYPTSPGTSHMSAVDISNPRLPRTLVTSQYNTHGMSVSDDGRRGYLATLSGLVIVDLSEVQERKPNPQIREISRLTWSNMTIPQFATPVTIDGKPYLIEVDEYSTTERGQHTGHGPRVGAARIIDISDERKPRVVSNIRLGVHQPEHRDEIAGDYGAQSSVQGYAAHYCNVPRRHEPSIVACSMITSGLRVFDIRDPAHPKEIAYFVAPPSMVSETGSPVIDERANWAMSQPDFAPERREIWYSDGTSGFYALKVDRDVWPFRVGHRERSCLSRRLPIGRRNIGRVRVGYTRRRLLRLRVQPVRRTRRSYRYCVKRSKGRVTAVFSRRGRVVLVTTTARSHGNRRVRPGRSARSLRAYPRRRAFGRGLFRANPRSRRLIGVRRGRVRFIAVANRRLLRRPRTLRRYLRLAGV